MTVIHIIPLSKQVLQILAELNPLTGQGKYLFPGIRPASRPMSENTINAALMTSHGFRSMASTLLNEQGWKPDAIERRLAHSGSNKVRADYNYAEYLPLD